VIEREVKAVVADPAGVVARLVAAGARPTFRGTMADRRFDRAGEFFGRDEVVRLREYRAVDGHPVRTQVGWKGPVSVDRGAKLRQEIEVEVSGDAIGLLTALGFAPIHAIDRRIEVFEYRGATVRLEWYPRMDVLVEVEGTEEAIDAAMTATGIDRAAFTAESLTAFVARYAARGLQPAVALSELGGGAPDWDPVS
jgi:adenylate cyclase class IV